MSATLPTQLSTDVVTAQVQDPIVPPREWTDIDRSKWVIGPWSDEPDVRVWRDQSTGYPFLLVRQSYSGHLCGYVGIHPKHPLYGKSYLDLYEYVPDETDRYCYGDLTFSDGKAPDGGRGVNDLLPNTHWFGFDFAHLGDLSPSDESDELNGRRQGYYKTVAHVERACRRLADRLADDSEIDSTG